MWWRLLVPRRDCVPRAGAVLDAPLKAVHTDGAVTSSTRLHRLERTFQRVLMTMFANRAINDSGLYPGGLPLEFAQVVLNNDLSQLTVRWALPTPLSGHVHRASMDWLAPDEFNSKSVDPRSKHEPQYKVRANGRLGDRCTVVLTLLVVADGV